MIDPEPLGISPPPALLSPQGRAAYACVLPVLEKLSDHDHQAFLVGGGIRDLLLDRPVGDWDIATSATPEAVMEIWPEAIPTGLRHGTVTLILDGRPVELTTYRAEGPYSDRRRPDWVRFGVSLAEDLSRRDFTINALALDPLTDRFVDNHGGLQDLRSRCIRTVGDPDERFSEDALRPLRAVRFAAVLEFDVDPSTLDAVGRAAPQTAGVAVERVREEFLKLLKAERPSIGLELLRTTGLLGALIPELLEGVDVEQNRYHAYDVWQHMLHTVDAAPPSDPVVRLAALFHDIGKPRTRRVEEGEGTFYCHERVGADMAREVMDRLRFPHRDRDRVGHLVAQHMFHYTPEWSDAAVRRFVQRVGRGDLDALFQLRRADNIGSGTKPADPPELLDFRRRISVVLAREDALDLRALAVSGRDIMEAAGLDSGPEVGRLLRELLDRVLERPELNDRDQLLALARDLAARPEVTGRG